MTTTTEPDTTPNAPTGPQPWFELAPKTDQHRTDPTALAAYWLTYAQAHFTAFNDATTGSVRDMTLSGEKHLRPYMMGFTTAALLRGWTPEGIADALDSGDVAAECTWEWLVEYGIAPDRIESAAAHLPRIERRLAEREAAEKAAAVHVPGQTVIEDHLTD